MEGLINNLIEEYLNFCKNSSERAIRRDYLNASTFISSLKRMGGMELIFSVIIFFTFLSKQIYNPHESSIIFWYMTYLNAAIPTLTIESLRMLSLKRTIRKFSTSKTNKERLYEFYFNELERAKVNDKTEILNRIINRINNDEKLKRTCPNHFTIKSIYEDKPIEELRREFDISKSSYNKLESELDILATQHFLNKELSAFRKKGYLLFLDIIIKLIGVVGFTALFLGLPLAFELVEDGATPDVLFNMLCYSLDPSFITLPIGTFIMIKENDKLASIFERINNSLGENKLAFRYDKEQAIKIEEELREKINALVELGVQIKNIEHYLLSKESQEQNEKKLAYSYLFDPAKPLDMGSSHTNSIGSRKKLKKKEEEKI